MRRKAVSPGSATYEVSRPPRWNNLLLGFVINAACVLMLVFTNPQIFRLDTQFVKGDDPYVTLVAPTRLPQPTEQRQRLVRPPLHTARIEIPKVFPPSPDAKPLPIPGKITPTSNEVPEVPANVGTSRPPSPAPEKVIKMDLFTTAKPARVNPPARQIETGGFGDPNGVSDQSAPNRQ